jgi:hypothetical protein
VAGSVVGRVGGAIGRGADAAADVAESVVGGAAQAVSDVVETVGTLARNGLDSVAGPAGRVPGAGPVFAFVLHWLATVVSAAFELGATAVHAVIDVVAGIVAGVVRLVVGGIGGLLARDARLARKGLGDIASSLAGSVVLVAGKSLALAQAVAFMQRGERALTGPERELLRQVFRGSVALYNVRLVVGFAGLFSVNTRPFTLGNTIYMKGDDPATNLDTLVHECTHVWQFQNLGVRYATDALWAQATIAGQGEYVWEDEPARGNTRWADFNREAQAALVQDVWRLGTMSAGSAAGGGVFYTDDPVGHDVGFVKGGIDHRALAAQCATSLRHATAWRLSALL